MYILLLLSKISSILCVKTILYKIPLVQYNAKIIRFNHLESPVWDADTQSLLFVDALQQNIHRLDIVDLKLYTKHVSYGQVNVVSLVAGSRRLLVGVRAALYLLDWDVPGDAALRLLVSLDEGLPDNVINEGKADAFGRFWTGTKGPQKGDKVNPDRATFYSIQQEFFISPRVQLHPVSISNGLAWALNNSVLYYIDSPTRKLEAFDFDLQRGDLSARRTIIDISDYGYEDGIPDGMAIDMKGHLWVAIMFRGTILHINPDNRQIIKRYLLPVKRTTSLCWGGPNLEYLFITTSREKTEEKTHGVIYVLINTGSYGVPVNKFRFDNANSY